MREPSKFTTWAPWPPGAEQGGVLLHGDVSVPAITEHLRLGIELQDVGRSMFQGPLPTRNRLWREYRNFMRQGMSNFMTGTKAEDRSACLLYYYAALNFAKAELLQTHPNAITGQKVYHGLSFDPTESRSMRGDTLTVHPDGVFPLLYEKRVGHAWPTGERLPVKRLLAQVPEISFQIEYVGLAETQTSGLLQVIAADDEHAWALLATERGWLPHANTERMLNQHFESVTQPDDWRDVFAVSRRFVFGMDFFESRAKVEVDEDVGDHGEAMRTVGDNTVDYLRGYLTSSVNPAFDSHLSPSLYKSRTVPLPADLARYALMFYGSSLVRYRPSSFDPQFYPDQALILDAIAREVGVPLLLDVASAIRGGPIRFLGSTGFRT